MILSWIPMTATTNFITLRVCVCTHIALSTLTHVSIIRKIIAANESSRYRYYQRLTKRRDPDFIDRIKRKKFVIIFWLFPRTDIEDRTFATWRTITKNRFLSRLSTRLCSCEWKACGGDLAPGTPAKRDTY